MAPTAQYAVLDHAALIDHYPVHEHAVQQLDVVSYGAACTDHAAFHRALLPDLASLAQHRAWGNRGLWCHRHCLMAEVALSIWLSSQECGG